MFEVIESFRYNNIDYKVGQKVDFAEGDLKVVAPFVKEIKKVIRPIENSNVDNKETDTKVITENSQKNNIIQKKNKNSI